MTSALRSLYRRLVRRAYLARGVRPCRVRIKVVGNRRHAVATAVGECCWWANAADVRDETMRAWRSARRAFFRRYGRRLKLAGAWRVRKDGDTWVNERIDP